MKFYKMLFMCGLFFVAAPVLKAQMFTPNVLATEGTCSPLGGTISLSSTLGQTFSPTISYGNLMLSQGFQQPSSADLGAQVTLNYQLYDNAGNNIHSDTAYGCEDYMQVQLGVEYNPSSGYSLSIALPPGAVFIPCSGTTTGAALSQPVQDNTGLLTWSIPDNYTQTFTVYAYIYFDCLKNIPADYTNNTPPYKLIMQTTPSGITTFINQNLGITIIWPGITPKHYDQYPCPDAAVQPAISICQSGGHIDDLFVTAPANYSGDLIISGPTNTLPPISPVTYNGITGYDIGPGYFNPLFSHAYLGSGECISVETNTTPVINAPVGCSSQNETFGVSMLCNSELAIPDFTPCTSLESNCGSEPVTDQIEVGDYANKFPVCVNTKLWEGSTDVTSYGFDMCSGAISIEYDLHNKKEGPIANYPPYPACANAKILQQLAIPIDPDWINTHNISITYVDVTGDNSYPINPVTTYTINGGGYIISGGTIYISLNNINNTTGNTWAVLGDDANAYIEISGLSINYETAGQPAQSCPMQGSDQVLGAADLQYTSLCNQTTTTSYNSFSNIDYTNNFAFDDGGSQPEVGGVSTTDITTDNPNATLNFCWQVNDDGSNPWNFTSTNGASQFFQCTDVTYGFYLNVNVPPTMNNGNCEFSGPPPAAPVVVNEPSSSFTVQISNGGPYVTFTEVTGTGIVPKTQYSALLAAEQIASLTSSGCIQIPVLWQGCSCNFAGGPITATLSVVAYCNDDNTPNTACTQTQQYCIGTLSNTLSVHCLGVCNGTGIGTSGGSISNLSAPGYATATNELAAYAYDLIDFNVSGQGYCCASSQYPTIIPPPIDNPYSTTGTAPFGETENIFLDITYPQQDGNDPIFTTIGASLCVTENSCSGCTVTPSCSDAYIPTQYQVPQPVVINGLPMWEIQVWLSTPLSQDIRTHEASFTIDAQLHVESCLTYSDEGIYNLSPINMQMEFNEDQTDAANTTIPAYSCDGTSGSLMVLDHTQYGLGAWFLQPPDGSNPCQDILIIRDTTIGGEPANPEMPGVTPNRPLITWPTDGSLTIYCLNTMTIQSITYSDYAGTVLAGGSFNSTYSIVGGDNVYGPTNGAYLVTGQPATIPGSGYGTIPIYGSPSSVTSSFTPYSWAAESKDGPEFCNQLQVVFNQEDCNENAVTVTVPHWQIDGLNSGDCSATSQGASIKQSVGDVEPIPMANPAYASITGPTTLYPAYPDPLTALSFDVNYTITPPTGLTSDNIWMSAHAGVAYTNNNDISLSGSGLTGLIYPVSSPVTYFDPGTLSPTFDVAIGPDCNPGFDQIILEAYYTCPDPTGANTFVQSSYNVCGYSDYSYTTIYVNEKDPVIALNVAGLSPAGVFATTFDNCKGVFCGDEKTWTLTLLNSSSGGLAFNPVFTLLNSGPALLDITEIDFYWGANTNGTAYPVTAGASGSLLVSSNYSLDLSTVSNLIPSANGGATTFGATGAVYLNPGDAITAVVHVQGDLQNCDYSTNLTAGFTCQDFCGITIGPFTQFKTYEFNLVNCGDANSTSATCTEPFATQPPYYCSNTSVSPALTANCPPTWSMADWGSCNPCSTEPVEISVLDNATLTISGTGGPQMLQQDGSFSVPSYNYNWSTGSHTNNPGSSLNSGPYYVTVCSSYPVTIYDALAMTDETITCSATATLYTGRSDIVVNNSDSSARKTTGTTKTTMHTMPEFSFKLYPNPTNSTVMVELIGAVDNYDLAVYDLLGQQILHQSGQPPANNLITFDLSSRSDGVYLVKVTADDKTRTVKVTLFK